MPSAVRSAAVTVPRLASGLRRVRPPRRRRHPASASRRARRSARRPRSARGSGRGRRRRRSSQRSYPDPLPDRAPDRGDPRHPRAARARGSRSQPTRTHRPSSAARGIPRGSDDWLGVLRGGAGRRSSSGEGRGSAVGGVRWMDIGGFSSGLVLSVVTDGRAQTQRRCRRYTDPRSRPVRPHVDRPLSSSAHFPTGSSRPGAHFPTPVGVCRAAGSPRARCWVGGRRDDRPGP